MAKFLIGGSADLRGTDIKVNPRYAKLESFNRSRAAREIPAYIGTWGAGGHSDAAPINRKPEPC